MKFSLDSRHVEGFPVVKPTGSISENSLVDLGKFIRDTCKESGVSGVIIDCRDIDGALTSDELYRATPAFVREVGRSIKVAYINRPPQWPPADDQFSRDIAYNRGAHLELFESSDDAARWLGGSE